MKRKMSLLLIFAFVITLLPINISANITSHSLSNNGLYIFEAEEYLTSSGAKKELIMDDSMASGGKIIYTGNANDATVTGSSDSDLSILFNVTTPGMYTMYYNLKMEGTSITYYVKVDGSQPKWIGARNLPKGDSYYKHEADAFFLTEGEHKIEIILRSGKYCIDQIILSNIGDAECLDNGSYDYRKITDNEYTYTDPLPEVLARKSHPRLIIQADNIDKVKSNLTSEENLDVYRNLIENANLNFDSCLLDTSYENNEDYNKLAYIEANAFLWLLSDMESDLDYSYAQKAVNGIKEYLSTYRAQYGSTINEEREALNAVFKASLVYDWCYDYLTKDDKNEIINACMKLFNASTMGKDILYTSLNAYNSDHAEEYMIMKNLYAFSIAVFDEYPKLYNDTWRFLKEQMIPSRNFRYENNDFNHQGDDYGSCRSGADWYFKLLLTQMGKGDLIDDNIKMQPYSHIYRRNPNGAFMNDGDVYQPSVMKGYPGGYLRTEFFLAAILYKDSYLKNEYYKIATSIGKTDMGDAQISPAMYLILNDIDLELKSKSELPLSKYFGDKSGVMVARTSWEDGIESNTMTVSMKIPEHNMGDHQHNDSGHFYIYYKGPLAQDSGVYEGTFTDKTRAEHRANYLTQTVAHNSMLIGGKGQRDISGISTYNQMINNTEYGEVLGYDYGPDMNKPSYTYLKGDLTKAYGTDVTTDYTRSLMFLNFFDEVYPGALIVFDRVTSSDSSLNKWLLQTKYEPSVTGNKAVAVNDGGEYNGRMINETLLPKSENLNINIVKGFVNNGVEYPASGLYYTSEYKWAEENGGYRLEISSNSTGNIEYYLNVIQVSENSDEIKGLESELMESASYYGVKIKDRVVYFSKNRSRTNEDISLSVSGDMEYEFAVADLKEGIWKVYKDDKEYQTVNVAAESGVAYFKGISGEYTLKYASATDVTKDFDIHNAIGECQNDIDIFNANDVRGGASGETYVYFKLKPEIKDGIVYVPLSEVKRLNKNAIINNDNTSVTLGVRTVSYKENSALVTASGAEYISKGSAYSKNDTLYVPVSSLSWVLKKEFTYDDYTNILSYKNNNSISINTGLTSLIEEKIEAFPLFFDGDENTFVSFATVYPSDISGYSVKEYGMLYHTTKENMTFDTLGKRVFMSKTELSKKGQFGIRLIFKSANIIPETFYLRPYVIFENEYGDQLKLYSKNSIVINRD